MQTPIRLGFIGCGGHGLAHAEAVFKLPALFRIDAAFDTHKAKARNLLGLSSLSSFTRTSDRPSLFLYDSDGDLLRNKEIDAVVIASPHQFHLDQLEIAVNHGKHVLCEKPLWVGMGGLTRAVQTLRLAAFKNLVITSCHLRRFELVFKVLKSKMPEFIQRYGNLTEISYRFFYKRPSTDWKKEDNLLLDHMNHEIDLVNFILGQTEYTLHRFCQGHDRYQVVGHRTDGVLVHFSGYRCLGRNLFRNEMELTFERGRVRARSLLINQPDGESSILPEVVGESFEGDQNSLFYFLRSSFSYSPGEPIKLVMQNFGQAILGQEPNYLKHEELLFNTDVCNILVEKGRYPATV